MKLLIINQPLKNRGDESAHRALIRKLVSTIPNVHIQVLTILHWRGSYTEEDVVPFMESAPNVEYVNISIKAFGLQRLVNYSIRSHALSFLCFFHPGFLKLAKYYLKADYVLCAPGGMCLGGFQNWAHLTLLYVAKLLGRKILYFGRSIGPFPEVTKANRIFKKGADEILKYSSYVSLRDAKSIDFAKTMSIECVSTVDTAYLDTPVVNLPEKIMELLDGNKYVIMVPNLLIWHDQYMGRLTREGVISFFVKIANCLLDKYKDAKIIMLPQTYGDKKDPANWNDYIFLKEVADACDNPNVIVLPDTYSSDVQQTIIRHALFLTGARYHSIVFAVNNMVPFISLSYEHKMSGMLETLGVTSQIVDISSKQLETEEEIEKTVALFKEKLKDVKFDKRVYDKAKEISENGFNKMLSVINK